MRPQRLTVFVLTGSEFRLCLDVQVRNLDSLGLQNIQFLSPTPAVVPTRKRRYAKKRITDGVSFLEHIDAVGRDARRLQVAQHDRKLLSDECRSNLKTSDFISADPAQRRKRTLVLRSRPAKERDEKSADDDLKSLIFEEGVLQEDNGDIDGDIRNEDNDGAGVAESALRSQDAGGGASAAGGAMAVAPARPREGARRGGPASARATSAATASNGGFTSAKMVGLQATPPPASGDAATTSGDAGPMRPGSAGTPKSGGAASDSPGPQRSSPARPVPNGPTLNPRRQTLNAAATPSASKKRSRDAPNAERDEDRSSPQLKLAKHGADPGPAEAAPTPPRGPPSGDGEPAVDGKGT